MFVTMCIIFEQINIKAVTQSQIVLQLLIYKQHASIFVLRSAS